MYGLEKFPSKWLHSIIKVVHRDGIVTTNTYQFYKAEFAAMLFIVQCRLVNDTTIITTNQNTTQGTSLADVAANLDLIIPIE